MAVRQKNCGFGCVGRDVDPWKVLVVGDALLSDGIVQLLAVGVEDPDRFSDLLVLRILIVILIVFLDVLTISGSSLAMNLIGCGKC